MPVTIQVAKHNARAVVNSSTKYSSHDMLVGAAPKLKPEIGSIIQSSHPDERLKSSNISPRNNGLVRAAFQAYTYHHHLIIRPEDVWCAILSQFSFFVNAHAEELRETFVEHKGKKGLVLSMGGLDYGVFCTKMTELIQRNLVDPDLRTWIMPNFSTTTKDDEVVAAVLMMGTFQKYFEYVFDPCTCGIPSVTLMGTKEDWEDIGRRIEKLGEYGEEPSQFRDLLRPILKYMVATFTTPPSSNSDVVDFWSRIVHYDGGSGMNSLSGWMSAFCFWDEDGKCLVPPSNMGYLQKLKTGNNLPPYHWLDEAVYHSVDLDEIPAGFVTVPVKLNDPDSLKMVDTKILAGSIGVEARPAVNIPYKAEQKPKLTHEGKSSRKRLILSSITCGLFEHGDKPTGETGNHKSPAKAESTASETSDKGAQEPKNAAEKPLDTLQPVSGWWMYTTTDNEFSDKDMSVDQFIAQRLGSGQWSGMERVIVRDGMEDEIIRK